MRDKRSGAAGHDGYRLGKRSDGKEGWARHWVRLVRSWVLKGKDGVEFLGS